MRADDGFAPPNRHDRFARDHIIVKFKPGVVASGDAGALKELARRLPLPPGARLVETAFAKAQRDRPAPAQDRKRQIDPNRHLLLRLPPGTTVQECLKRLEGNPLLAYAEPDAFVKASLTTPNDPGFPLQWHHLSTYSNGTVRADIHTAEAWDITTGSSNVIVGLLDTGLSIGLTEFAGRVVPGYSFVTGTTNVMDDAGHGTAVAGVLAANGNNSIGVAGVDWHCRLMPVKVLNQYELGMVSWYADGIDFAVMQGCNILNLSFAHFPGEPTETVAAALTNAIAQGVTVVGLADNGGGPTITFPGSLTNIITVGSTDRTDHHVWSNYGPATDLVAPGSQIYTINQNGDVFSAEGNSASAPMVSGAAALLLSLRPDMRQDEVWTLLCAGADDQVGPSNEDLPGFDNYYGWGRLNVYNSVLLLQSRIQSLQVTNVDQVQLCWTCPPNAAMKRPFRIEWAGSIAGPWTTLNGSTNIVYAGMKASWTDDGSETGGAATKFYRLRVTVQ